MGLSCNKANPTGGDNQANKESGDQQNKEIALLKEKAEKGDVNAQLELGGKYVSGEEGVEEDYKEAAKWFSLAAQQNNPKAQYALGFLYYTGEGVTQDYAEAFRLTKLSAEQGIGDAQYLLANMYRNGRGVAVDLVRAYMWASLSIANLLPETASDPENIQDIENLKATLLASMTAEQKQQAEQQAITCKNNNYKNC